MLPQTVEDLNISGRLDNPRPIKELYWAAGFLEGEGSFVAQQRQSSIYIAAVQVQKEPLERLQVLFGGCINLKIRTNPKHQNAWVWTLTGYRAYGVAATLYSIMSPRRKGQVEKVLKSFNVSRPQITSDYVPAQCRKGHKLKGENLRFCARRTGEEKRRWVCRLCHKDAMRRHKIKLLGLNEVQKLLERMQ